MNDPDFETEEDTKPIFLFAGKRATRIAAGTRSDLTVQATPGMLREMARRFFRAGFKCSGKGFNGETGAGTAPAVEALLEAEFDRLWAEERR